MTLSEFRLDFLERIRVDAQYNSTSPEEQFITSSIETLVDLGELTDPYPISCFTKGRRNRVMAFDCYGFDEVDNSIVLLISDFKNTDEISTLTNTRIDELCKRMLNFVEEAYTGNIRDYCDDSDEAIDVADQFKQRLKKNQQDNEIYRFKLIIITNSTLSTQVKNLTRDDFLERIVELNVWTLERFYNNYASDNSELIDINCEDFDNNGIQCLKADMTNTDYDAYLAIVPGKFIADIFIKYGSRLLQGNVRAYLGGRGAKNKGIKETILKEPNRFFTYNNGIAVVSRKIKLSNDGTKILSFADFQIINGGQTSASLASVVLNKKYESNLEDVFVPMKLTVLNIENEMSTEDLENYDSITQKISKYANTQNNVTEADFFSNSPFHVMMEELSNKVFAPPVNGLPYQTRWYYERKVKYAQATLRMTESEKNRFKRECPKSQVFNKEKLAKCMNSVWQTPYSTIVSSGKSMNVFSARIGQIMNKSRDNINEAFFKKAVCSVIIFNSVDRLINKADWYPKGGNKAEIVPYCIAKLFSLIPEGYDIDWKLIWNKQSLYPALYNQLDYLAYQTYLFLEDTDGVKAREYAKRAENWKKYRDTFKLEVRDDFIATLIPIQEIKDDEKAAKRSHKFNSDIDATVEIYNLGYQYWIRVYNDLATSHIVSTGNCDFVKVIANIINKGSLPTPKQVKRLLRIIQEAEDNNYIMP